MEGRHEREVECILWKILGAGQRACRVTTANPSKLLMAVGLENSVPNMLYR